MPVPAHAGPHGIELWQVDGCNDRCLLCLAMRPEFLSSSPSFMAHTLLGVIMPALLHPSLKTETQTKSSSCIISPLIDAMQHV